MTGPTPEPAAAPETVSPDRSLRALIPFAALSGAYFAHIGFFNPYLTLWLKDLGLPLLVISLVVAAQPFTRVFAPYIWGLISDRTGQRVQLLRFSAVTAAVTSMGLFVDGGVAWMAVVLFVLFVLTSSMMGLTEAAMAHVVAGDWGRYGRVRLWGSAGFLVTVFVAGAWFERFGMHHFPGWAVATLLGVAACTFWLPRVHDRPTQGVRSHAPIGPVLRQPVVVWFFVSLFFHVMAHMAIYAYLSLFLDNRGYSKTVIGALWALSVLAEIAWFFWQGKFIGSRPMSWWLLVCAWATVIRMALTGGLADWWPALVVGQLLHALTFAGHHTACVAMVTLHFPGTLRGRGQALFTAAGYGLGGVIGVVAGGTLVELMGYEGLFAAATLLALSATASAWQLRRTERRLESQGLLADGTGRSA